MLSPALLADPITFALIGSRSPDGDDAEASRLRELGTWLARHGVRCRSGGAPHADQAWADGVAAVDPALLTGCLPGVRFPDHRVPDGATVLRPPYHPRYDQLAGAEWDDLMPTYPGKPSWLEVRAKKPWLAELMIHNAVIVAPTPTSRVAMVLAVYPTEGDGGGTGHGIRLAKALGAHTVNLRDPGAWAAARPIVRAYAEWARTGVRPALLAPPPPRVVDNEDEEDARPTFNYARRQRAVAREDARQRARRGAEQGNNARDKNRPAPDDGEDAAFDDPRPPELDP